MKKILILLYLYFLSFTAYAQINLAQGLIAYYPFDGSANDLSGNNIHGVVNNASLTTDRNGQPNSAYYFDGSSSYIQLPYSSLYDFKPNDSFSISVRVLPDQGYSWPAQALVVKSPFSPDFNTSNWNYGAYLLNYKAMTGYAANSVLVGSTSFTGNPPCWYNIVATYKDGAWRLYVNGVLEASDLTRTRFILQDGPASKIAFGKKGDANGDYYKGKMDDIRIYHRVLNQDEINVLSSCPTAQQFCTGTLGAPIVNIDFGSGASNPGSTLSTIVPGASTTYNFASYATGNPPAVPIDGDYALVNAVPNNSAWYTGAKDHTGNPNGYMGFFNSAPTPGKFYQQTVNGLCGGTTYEFAVWVANVIKPNVLPNAILPNITFQILDPNNQQVIGSLNTGDIPMATSMIWKPYSFLFTLPGNLNSIILVLANNNIGGNAQPGNDLAIDDITFRACGPKTTASFSSNSDLNTLSVNSCDNSIEVYGNISSGLNDPVFQWQISNDNGNTFVDIPNATTVNYTLTNLAAGNYKLRLLSAEEGNISASSCRFISDTLFLTKAASPPIDFTFSQDICNPKLVTFTTNNTDIVNWDMGNGTLVGNLKTNNVLYADYGIYAVKLRATYANGCMDSVIKQVPVRLTIDSLITTRDTTICGATSFQLKALPALEYCWSPATGLSATNIQNPVISGFISKTTYYLNSLLTGPNLIVNGDFSTGNTGFSSDYAYKAQNISTSNYLIDVSPVKGNISFSDCRDHTTGNGNMMAIDASPVANQKVWKQTITVNPNTNYAFSCWISSIYPDNPAKLQFYINGNLIGNIFNALGTTCQWQQFYTVWNAGNITSAEIAIVNQNTQGHGNDFALDDISFSELKMLHDSVTVGIYDKPKIDFNHTVPFCKSPQFNGLVINEPYPINTWEWNFGDNRTAYMQAPPHSYTKGGTYNVKVLSTDVNGCKDSTIKTIQLDTATAVASFSGAVCPGGIVTLQGSGGTHYEWSPGSSVNNPTSQNTTANLNTNTKFYLKVTDAIGCEDTASVLASLIPKPAFSKPADMQTCKGNSIILNANANPSYQYTWTPADYLNDPNIASPIATPDISTEYIVHITEPRCSYDTSFTIKTMVSANANVFVLPNAFTPNGDGKNDCFGIRNWGYTTIREFLIYNRWGQKVFETKNPSHCWDGKYKGQSQNEGAYIYIIKALTPCGEVERKGSFMLVR